MLVLTQRAGETTRLTLTEPLPAGTEIFFTILENDYGKIRIGHTCPQSVKIERHALWLGNKQRETAK